MPICRGELRHAIEKEKARSLTDVLARRTRLAMVDLEEAQRLTPLVKELLQQCGHGGDHGGGIPLELHH